MLLLLISCGSDDDAPAPVEETAEPQIRVRTINENDVNFYEVFYGQDGRISNINSTGNQNANIPYAYNAQSQPTLKGGTIYEYNTEGNLGKITSSNYTAEITYGQEGRMVLEEAATAVYTLNKTFKYNPQGQLIEIDANFNSNSSGLVSFTRYLFTYDSTGNIIETLVRESNDDLVYTDRYTIKFAYDDKKNPLLNLHQNSGGAEGVSHYMEILRFHTDAITFLEPSLYFYGKNNLLLYTRTDLTDNKQYRTTYQHQYNDDGYPEVTTITQFNPNSQTSNEIFYDWTYEKK